LAAPETSSEVFGQDLAVGRSSHPVRSTASEAEDDPLVEEVELGCSAGMLLCLDRPHREACVLGEIPGLDHRGAAQAPRH